MKKVTGILVITTIIIGLIIVYIASKPNDLYKYIEEKSNFKVMSVRSLDGEINIELEYGNDENWRTNDNNIKEHINLDAFILLNNIKHMPVKSIKDIKEINISYFVNPEKYKLASFKISNNVLYKTNWEEKESFEIPQIVDYSEYNIKGTQNP